MIPYQHQIDLKEDALAVLKKYNLVYLACEERTGKTLTSILIAEEHEGSHKILVVTKKNALAGWQDTLDRYPRTKMYDLINYHQAGKCTAKYDLIILDEAHNYLSKYPKIGKIHNDVSKLTREIPIIYISATPHAQGYQQVFHQFSLSSYSPFNHFKSFYEWFALYGIPSKVITPVGLKETYKKVKSDAIASRIKHLFVSKTRKSLGFQHEPEDILHYINLDEKIVRIFNQIVKDKVSSYHYDIYCDSLMKERITLHMLEGGLANTDYEVLVTKELDKVNYIKANFKKSDSVVIMHHYIDEGKILNKHFPDYTILSATKFSEGVDLSAYSTLIIYSQGFSTAQHIQRRARQCNKWRNTPIKVHYLLVKNGISEQVYNTVALNKKNFTDKIYRGQTIE